MSTQDTNATEPNGRNWPLLTAGFVILIAIALIFIYGLNPLAQPSDVPANSAVSLPEQQQLSLPDTGPPLQVGDLPYNFTLSDLEGNQVALDQFIGRPLIINYWATWCGPCRIEMPHLQNTFESQQEDGLVLLALDQDETKQEVSSFFDEFGLTFTPLLDIGQTTSQNYGVGRTLPTTFFINPDGEITAIHRGPMTQSQIDSYLEQTIPAA